MFLKQGDDTDIGDGYEITVLGSKITVTNLYDDTPYNGDTTQANSNKALKVTVGSDTLFAPPAQVATTLGATADQDFTTGTGIAKTLVDKNNFSMVADVTGTVTATTTNTGTGTIAVKWTKSDGKLTVTKTGELKKNDSFTIKLGDVTIYAKVKADAAASATATITLDLTDMPNDNA